jgi:hypothetical protein
VTPGQIPAGHPPDQLDLEMGQLGASPPHKATSSDEGEATGEEDHRWPLVRRSARQSNAPS